MGKQRNLASQALARIGKDWSKSSLTREKLLSNTKELRGEGLRTGKDR